MQRYIYDNWNSVMDSNHNPLRHIPDLQVRHLVMQILAFMWATVFSIMIVNSLTAFMYSAIGHIVFVGAVVITVATFKTAETNPGVFKLKKGYHSPGRSRNYMWINGEKFILPENDPGGEHE
jgi:hypothetical protein